MCHGRRLTPSVHALFTCLLAGLAGGCDDGPSLREVVRECAALELTKASDHAELVSEIKRLEAENATPLAVGRPLPPDNQNAAVLLAKAIDPKLRTGILERSAELFPQGKFQFGPLQLAEVLQFRGKHQQRHQRFYEALRRSACAFDVDFKIGFFYEPAFVDDVTIGCRWMAFEVAELLDAGEVSAAMRPLDGMFQLCGWLGQQRLITARLRAAELRAEALLVVEAVANHENARREDLVALRDIIQQQLDSWPADSESLIGDRAMTLHTYECLRRGLMRWVLTKEEKERFESEYSLDSLPQVIVETIDDDEFAYLTWMQQMIQQCGHPYFQRKVWLAEFWQEIDTRRTNDDRSQYPLLAATLFLPGLDDAMQTMARDRARCEAWEIALAHACGNAPPDYSRNPHHGLPYDTQNETRRIVVQLHEPDERDVVVVKL